MIVDKLRFEFHRVAKPVDVAKIKGYKQRSMVIVVFFSNLCDYFFSGFVVTLT